MTPEKFRVLVWRYYRVYGRHDLPWRKTHDPYKILVSEVMLQQTQVERVLPFYIDFLKKFPTARALAKAPLSDVLKSWQGLGYNRRAKLLQQAAKDIGNRFGGRFPESVTEMESLPGVGPYTARAVAAFGFNQDVVVIETNIRTAVIHHFFPEKKKVSDAEIEKILLQALPKGKSRPVRDRNLKSSGSSKTSVSNGAREWYGALMDYGSHLKRSGVSLNTKSARYAKQSKFAGSLREARGAILRRLAEEPASLARLTGLLGASRRTQMLEALRALCSERLVQKKNQMYSLAD